MPSCYHSQIKFLFAALVCSLSIVSAAPSTIYAKFIPNSVKAGISAGDAFDAVKDHIGWWYDWTPAPRYHTGKPVAVSMLWGDGTADRQDADRLATFKKLTTVPQFLLGFEEPDCASGHGSAGMTVQQGVDAWEKYIAPMKAKGALLGSPSMCKQADETWLAEFKAKIKTPWDFTAIHINKQDLEGVKRDIKHYKDTYGLPIWVTELACVNDVNGFAPCTDQSIINNFIDTVVPYLQSNADVTAYAYSNGQELGDVWPMTKSDGSLSESGKRYISVISKYH
ncbi:hypothetical protein CPB83DRAFT_406199 [Crepidotus variabilis]|uniref:Asl1-like glycosyl hydrolase catalytic domain-containing protein n=1 Tax=Crepidotus variabilis TaxID=179855 RepID=A0A9P6JU17_9AGAR|nr:hypothetical protein CPB83DRAFT_406199 [Crepidotus variabilis]